MALAYVTVTPGVTAVATGTTAILSKLAVTGSAADFTSENPTLAAGQVGRETDTTLFKVGDGSTAWTSLTYAGSIPAGGTTGQVLAKATAADFDAEWVTPAGAGLGDVVGPASSTDSHFAQFDGTTGKLLKGGIAPSSKADLASPTFTGTPAAPTAAPGTNTTQLATTAFVDAGLALKVTGPASATADTLARWDGTTGKLLKDGLAFIDDDTMATASAANVASAESTKAYVDAQVADTFGAALDALPDGTIWTDHGGAVESLVPAHRETVGNGAVQLNEGAFLPVAAEAAPTVISAATYTILASDHGKRLHFTHATPAITVGTQAAQTYPDGFYCLLTSVNAYTVTGSTGVDLNGVDAEVLTGAARPQCGMLDRLGSDDWNGLGGLAA